MREVGRLIVPAGARWLSSRVDDQARVRNECVGSGPTAGKPRKQVCTEIKKPTKVSRKNWILVVVVVVVVLFFRVQGEN